mgnify:CR=1 FL=1
MQKNPLLIAGVIIAVLGFIAGLAVIGWSIGRFGLGQPGPRAEFWRTGRLEEAQ